MARGDVSRCVDFSLKWGRNRKKIDILKIEFRTLVEGVLKKYPDLQKQRMTGAERTKAS